MACDPWGNGGVSAGEMKVLNMKKADKNA